MKNPNQTSPKRPPRLPGEKRRPIGRAPHTETNEPDPIEGEFTLEQATEGLEGSGELVAEIAADLGRLKCVLYAEKVPRTVANFVGLVRGKRPWWDPYSGGWVKRRFYDGLNFHQVIPGLKIQGGSPTSDGATGPGYSLQPEIVEELVHDRAGVLSMAADGEAISGSQFFILDGPAPHLNGRSVVFGQCEPADAVFRIARVPQGGEGRPLTDVMIRSIRIRRQ